MAVPALCAAYIAFERYGASRSRRYGPAVLCVGLVGLIPLNTKFGFEYEAWYHDRVDVFAADIEAGMPMGQLNYFHTIAFDNEEMQAGMRYLRDAGIGVFRTLQTEPVTTPSKTVVDGFDDGPDGWVTAGGDAATSNGTIRRSGGGPALRWDYDASDGTVAVLGRAFARPQDWRGQGAIAITATGEGSGRMIRVRLAVDDRAHRVDRYDSWFMDDFTGTQTIVIPWNGFGHVTMAGQYDWNGPMPLDRMVAVAFVVTDPGAGTLIINEVALQAGHGQIGWPLHPAAERRSLPPWR